MRYYKIVSNGYISSIGIGAAGNEITVHEYNAIMDTIKKAPTVPDGYEYRLTESLDWELYPVEMPDISDEATADDYQAALAEMGVQV